MILAIDIGNTNIVIGGFENDSISFTARVATDVLRTEEQYAVEIHQILHLYGYSAKEMEGSIISSVVPPLTTVMKTALKQITGKKPMVVGPGLKTGLNIKLDNPASLGADRVTLAFLVDAYDEEVVGQDKNGKDDVRVVLHLHPALAPYKAAILPLSKKLSEPAMEIYNDLCKDFMLDFDETGSIGKRYRREDEIGTPFCITVDFDTVGDGENPGDRCVTVRERDTMEQVRIPISELKAYLTENLAY